MTAKKTTATVAAQDALKPVEAAVTASKETVEAVVKAGSEAAAKQYEQAVSMTKDNIEKTSSALFQGYDELANVNKDNLQALVEASNVMAKGVEAMTKEIFSFAQGSMAENVAVAKKLLGVKNAQELFDMSGEVAKNNFDKTLAETAKLTEMSVKVANETFQPLQSRFNVTVEKMIKSAA